MQHQKEGPPTVAAPIGREGAKLLQRFDELDSANRRRILRDALGMIERQREEELPERVREATRLVDRVENTLGQLSQFRSNTIQGRVMREVLADDCRTLARMGITYFGGIAHA